MANSIRQRWDSVNDRPLTGRASSAESNKVFNAAISQDIPEYRAKVVRLAHGQIEVSITPANRSHVIDARMGFNPLLDCPRYARTDEEQQERDIENRGRSAKRAKQRVRFLIKSITADYMLTFTYRENMTDRAKAARDWKEFVRLYRKRFPDWQYVATIEEQERGALHFHVAVSGKQNIKWLLRSWLIAIGQSTEEVDSWYVHGKKLGDKSFGAVNVEPPKKRWNSGGNKWHSNKLAGYLTKYLGKEFEVAEKNAKKYWHSKNISQPVIERYWLRAKTFLEAVCQAHDIVMYSGVTSMSMWADNPAGVVWITGETSRDKLGQCVSVPRDSEEFDFLYED